MRRAEDKREKAENRKIGGKYRILRCLGRGGEGTVYLVQHCITEQYRAAKRLDRVSGERQYQEIHAMKKLDHPSLPQVFDVIQEEEFIWLILEYVEGRCIHAIPREEVTEEQFWRIAEQLSQVLVYLHTRPVPVFHLDIKPSNLILRPDGRLVLIDFGTAIRLDGRKELSSNWGTRGFASPEQFQKDGRVDGRSDIYAAGAVLYYYLFGKTCSCGMEPLKQIGRFFDGRWGRYKKELQKQGKKVPLWKRRTVRLLGRCLCRDPMQRFADSNELMRAVVRGRKRFGWRQQMKNSGLAVIFLMFVLIFSAKQMQAGMEGGTEVSSAEVYEQNCLEYGRLLEQADSLGFEQAIQCYMEAAEIFPEEGSWAIQLMGRIEDDFWFSLDEEAALREILFCPAEDFWNAGQEKSGEFEADYLEVLKKNKEQYGWFCYRLGRAYWYFYEGTGGKRAAAEWFRSAADAGSEQEIWWKYAQVYAKISTYYEKLGKKDADGKEQADPAAYWMDLKELWYLNGRMEESLEIQKQLAGEILSCIILYTKELERGGVNSEEIRKVMEEIENLAEQLKDKDMQQQYEAAARAIRRVYG